MHIWFICLITTKHNFVTNVLCAYLYCFVWFFRELYMHSRKATIGFYLAKLDANLIDLTMICFEKKFTLEISKISVKTIFDIGFNKHNASIYFMKSSMFGIYINFYAECYTLTHTCQVNQLSHNNHRVI